jgi:hypothetical protein
MGVLCSRGLGVPAVLNIGVAVTRNGFGDPMASSNNCKAVLVIKETFYNTHWVIYDTYIELSTFKKF